MRNLEAHVAAANVTLLCCAARPEPEIYACAAHRDELAEGWEEIRVHPRLKELAKGKVLVTNWHWFSPEPDVVKIGGVAIGKLGEETPEAFARTRLGDLWDDEPLMVLNDEGHHAYRPLDGRSRLSDEEKPKPSVTRHRAHEGDRGTAGSGARARRRTSDAERLESPGDPSTARAENVCEAGDRRPDTAPPCPRRALDRQGPGAARRNREAKFILITHDPQPSRGPNERSASEGCRRARNGRQANPKGGDVAV